MFFVVHFFNLVLLIVVAVASINITEVKYKWANSEEDYILTHMGVGAKTSLAVIQN